jgi:hypothetical protein
MGYYMDQQDTVFNILAKNKTAALKAIKELMAKVNTEGYGGSWSNGVKETSWFGWVDTKDVLTADTLEDALYAWRWEASTSGVAVEDVIDAVNEAMASPDYESGGDIEYIEFIGEKLGQDFLLFQTIAPFVEDGSFIQMHGEDGCIWQWQFKNGTCKEKNGKLIFE